MFNVWFPPETYMLSFFYLVVSCLQHTCVQTDEHISELHLPMQIMFLPVFVCHKENYWRDFIDTKRMCHRSTHQNIGVDPG